MRLEGVHHVARVGGNARGGRGFHMGIVIPKRVAKLVKQDALTAAGGVGE
jgi:hypothetical protein